MTNDCTSQSVYSVLPVHVQERVALDAAPFPRSARVFKESARVLTELQARRLHSLTLTLMHTRDTDWECGATCDLRHNRECPAIHTHLEILWIQSISRRAAHCKPWPSVAMALGAMATPKFAARSG